MQSFYLFFFRLLDFPVFNYITAVDLDNKTTVLVLKKTVHRQLNKELKKKKGQAI